MSLGSLRNIWRGMLITHTVLGQLQGIPKVATEFSQHLIKTCTEVGAPYLHLPHMSGRVMTSIIVWCMSGCKTLKLHCLQPALRVATRLLHDDLSSLQMISENGSEDQCACLVFTSL